MGTEPDKSISILVNASNRVIGQSLFDAQGFERHLRNRPLTVSYDENSKGEQKVFYEHIFHIVHNGGRGLCNLVRGTISYRKKTTISS